MSMAMAEAMVAMLVSYLALGIVFALVFVVRGVATIDPAARGMPRLARLLILPGVAGLWPLLLWKWLTRQVPPVS